MSHRVRLSDVFYVGSVSLSSRRLQLFYAGKHPVLSLRARVKHDLNPGCVMASRRRVLFHGDSPQSESFCRLFPSDFYATTFFLSSARSFSVVFSFRRPFYRPVASREFSRASRPPRPRTAFSRSLDRLLDGGLLAGDVVELVGSTATGKTQAKTEKEDERRRIYAFFSSVFSCALSPARETRNAHCTLTATLILAVCGSVNWFRK